MEWTRKDQRQGDSQRNRPAGVMPDTAGTDSARMMGNQCALQRYTQHRVQADDDVYNIKVSDDMSVASCEENKHCFFARSGDVKNANRILQEKSKIHLVNLGRSLHRDIQADLLHSGINTAGLQAVTAEYRENIGHEMIAPSDCGDFTRLVVGTENLHGIYGDDRAKTTSSEDNPAEYRSTVLDQAREIIVAEGIPPFLDGGIPLILYDHIRNTRNLRHVVQQVERESSTLEGIMVLSGQTSLKTLQSEIPVTVRQIAGESAALQHYVCSREDWGEGDLIPEEVLMALLMNSHVLSQRLCVNAYAAPAVGEGFVTVSSEHQPFPKFKDKTWKFHWGGVVMESSDRADKIVIENFADYMTAEKRRSPVPVENNAWEFNMYGTRRAGQTFHGAHYSTKLHGISPTTVSVAADTHGHEENV